MFGVDKITKSEDITLVTINSLPSKASLIADIFEQTAKKEINIDMISQTTAQGLRVRLEFLRYPHLIRQLFNGGRFGPP